MTENKIFDSPKRITALIVMLLFAYFLISPAGKSCYAAMSKKDERSQYTIGIDPGHQSEKVYMSALEPNGPGSSVKKAKCTTGTVGNYSGVPEYQLNLDVSLKLRDLLEKMGYKTVMTREDNNKAISNKERALLMGDEGADICVRIHGNSLDDHSVSGALCMTVTSSNPYVSYLYKDSYRLADDILSSYCRKTGFKNLGIQQTDTMTGLNWSTVPTVIIEMGFMSNCFDDLMMQKGYMQKKMVKGIANGIDDYFKIGRKGSTEKNSPESLSKKLIEQKNDRADELSFEKETEQPFLFFYNFLEAFMKALDTDNDQVFHTKGPLTVVKGDYLQSREQLGEHWAFSYEELDKNIIYGYHETDIVQSASVIKVFIMGAVFEHTMKEPPSVSDNGMINSLLNSMITVSDNNAANSLVEYLGDGDFNKGLEKVNDFCQRYGYVSTSLGRRFMESDPAKDNYTSSEDCRKILSDIYHKRLLSEYASIRMLDLLKRQTVRYKIPAGLPDGYLSANKTGEMPEGYNLGCIENDMAIVYPPENEGGPYVIVVLSSDLAGANAEAQTAIVNVSHETALWNSRNN